MYFIIYEKKVTNHDRGEVYKYLMSIKDFKTELEYIEISVDNMKSLRTAILELFPITEAEIDAVVKAEAIQLVDEVLDGMA